MPTSACVEPKCDGLIVRVGVHERVHKNALQLARKVVRRNLSGKWNVQPMGKRARDFEVTRAGRRKAIRVGTAWDYVYRLRKDREVVDAEPALHTAGLEPDSQLAAQQLTSWEQLRIRSVVGGEDKACSTAHDWSIKLTRLDKAWKLPLPSGGKRFGKGIRIAHPDTGYTHHPEIWKNPSGTQRLASGYDFVDGDSTAFDPLLPGNPGHGTRTSSVIMSDIGFHDGAPFVTGAAPEASLFSYRVIELVVVFRFANVVKAIYQAVDRGCHVISMSLGGLIGGNALPRAAQYAVERGVILLAAAGNYWPWVVYPAKLDEVIAVAASNCQNEPWWGSAAGRTVDVAAPGESVWTAVTTKKDDKREYGWSRGHGTSFAVATTAGACALWMAHHGRKKLIQAYGKDNLASIFKEVLVKQGVRTPPGWKTDKYGRGILDAERLLAAKLPKTANAQGMKILPRGGAAPMDTIAELSDFFPGHGITPVRLALAAELRIEEIHLDELLAVFGDEITFHIATNTGFRQSVQNRLMGLKIEAATASRQLGKQASRALKKTLKI